jgi:hypothetical protein
MATNKALSELKKIGTIGYFEDKALGERFTSFYKDCKNMKWDKTFLHTYFHLMEDLKLTSSYGFTSPFLKALKCVIENSFGVPRSSQIVNGKYELVEFKRKTNGTEPFGMTGETVNKETTDRETPSAKQAHYAQMLHLMQD